RWAACDRPQRCAACRQIVLVGAGCLNWARPDLCGGRSVMTVPTANETYIGGKESGLSGGRAKGKKVLTCIAIEIVEPKGFGRCRMAPVADASSESLQSFVLGGCEFRCFPNSLYYRP